jgi:hypothetical protein
MFPGFSIKAFRLGAALRTINRFRACRSNDWNRRTRLSLKSLSVSRQTKDFIIREVYYAIHNMSSGKHFIWAYPPQDPTRCFTFHVYATNLSCVFLPICTVPEGTLRQ